MCILKSSVIMKPQKGILEADAMEGLEEEQEWEELQNIQNKIKNDQSTRQTKILEHLDIGYSYELAKRMEQFRSNEALGYRPAGSRAEFETGEMLKCEMQKLGLSSVTKDAVKIDGWEFKKAVLSYQLEDGRKKQVLLGAYQTTMVTDGSEEYSLMYVGKGTEKEYEGKDVTGKLVLAEINQRDEWWINYPVYQAHLKGAKAVIAVQTGGYGEIDEEALNAQDIAGPENAPAFSISRKDARDLKRLLEKHEEIKVFLDADTQVKRDCVTYNITGRILGKHPDRIVLLSAHYDSYFSGFQDDNTAVAMMFGIAKAFLETGEQPNNTILFCAMAAEEWGVADSNFDWSAGAYEQVMTAHPEWAGQVIADLNFELPALAHGTRARIRSCYEYTEFLETYLKTLQGVSLTEAYPQETTITAPIETWSDDFSMAIAGIPSMVNDFTGGSFMETHYHSQFDNDTYYDESVYRLHHELFALLVEALDHTAVVPLNFAPVMKRAAEKMPLSVSKPLGEGGRIESGRLQTIMQEAQKVFEMAEVYEQEEYEKLEKQNEQYAGYLSAGLEEQAEQCYQALREKEQTLLKKFKLEQDTFVRIDWYGNVLYPHEIIGKNLQLLENAICHLSQKELSKALENLYQIDNNAYAFMFDEQVYNHFTEYVLHQSKDRLKWGYHRLMEHANLYHLVKTLLRKQKMEECDFNEEIQYLKAGYRRQCGLLEKELEKMMDVVRGSFWSEKQL